ncbi:MAG: ExbD/TolR family protein [Planctomycetota bacterium]
MNDLRRIDMDDATSAPRIDISPLIDMVFLLLIFFMVTTAFVEETGVDVQKPRAASGEDLEKESIMIAVTEDGEVIHGGKEIGLRGVRGLVSRLLEQKDRPVVLLTDRNSRTGLAVKVIDECKIAGAETVSLATEQHD